MPGSNATWQLTEFTRSLAWSDISEPAREAAQRAVLDSIGCMLGGSQTEFAQRTRHVVKALGGVPQATLVGAGGRTSMPLAAFMNSIHANVLDYDDAFERDGKGMGHPGATVVPAALAAAEHKGASGADFLSAVVAGYEAANRIIEAIQPTPQRHAQVWGVAVHQAFGAAVTTACSVSTQLPSTTRSASPGPCRRFRRRESGTGATARSPRRKTSSRRRLRRA